MDEDEYIDRYGGYYLFGDDDEDESDEMIQPSQVRRSALLPTFQIKPPKPPKPRPIRERKKIFTKSLCGNKKVRIFSDFSFEPTFQPGFPVPKSVFDNENLWWAITNNLQKNLKINTFIHPWRRKIYNDSGNIEVPTGKSNNYNQTRKLMVKLFEQMEKHHLTSSSVADLQTEGGCHINFNMKPLVQTRDKIMKTMRSFVCANPSIAWMFLSPYDDQSSIVIYRPEPNLYRKGHFFCWHSGQERLELRFFMMPRDMKEFDIHFEFANCLMLWSEEQVKANNKIDHKRKRSKKDYTLQYAIKEFKEVCNTIGFDYQKVVNIGKLELLKTRFSLEPKYLK